MSVSETDTDEEPSPVEKALRTVTPPYRSHEDPEMDVIGWGLFLGIVILLVPLLPFIALVWLISKVFEGLAGR